MKPAFMLVGVVAMLAEPSLDPASAENFVRYALTQGGLLSLVLVLGWSYRRDMLRVADARSERIELLMEMNQKATEAQTKTADALVACTNALATQAGSIQSISNTLTELKGAISRRAVDH